MRLEGLKINFLGDSITEGHGASFSGKDLRRMDAFAGDMALAEQE